MIARKHNFITLRALAALAILFLAGCASTPPAPIEDRSLGHSNSQRPHSSQSTGVPLGSYRVRKGDTLYSIAFRNGLDYRDVARSNRIGSPYTIYIGQIIRLDQQAAERREVVVANPKPSRLPSRPTRPAEPLQSSSAAPNTPPSADAAKPSMPSPVSRPPEPARGESVAISAVQWRWPAEGQLVAGFVGGDQTRQGVNIAGKSGDPVRATADGEVVYSGNGLIGYGELIIVKHNSTMLSAYGHNRRRLVQEGDRVKAGQQIAEMGSSSASRDMLHFEIRRNGKPVDPLGFLPKR